METRTVQCSYQDLKNKIRKYICTIFNTFSKDVGIFCWFIWLQKVNLFKNSFFFNNDKLNSELEVQFSLVALTLRWVLYIRKALMTGLLIFPGVKPTWLYCGMLRLLTLIEKNLFKTLAVSSSVFMILSPQNFHTK